MCAISLRLLYLTGLGTTRGHTSVRIPGTDTFFIKPWPHIQMHRARAEDLIVMDLEGNIVGAGVVVNSRFASPASAFAVSMPNPIMYADWAAVS